MPDVRLCRRYGGAPPPIQRVGKHLSPARSARSTPRCRLSRLLAGELYQGARWVPTYRRYTPRPLPTRCARRRRCARPPAARTSRRLARGGTRGGQGGRRPCRRGALHAARCTAPPRCHTPQVRAAAVARARPRPRCPPAPSKSRSPGASGAAARAARVCFSCVASHGPCSWSSRRRAWRRSASVRSSGAAGQRSVARHVPLAPPPPRLLALGLAGPRDPALAGRRRNTAARASRPAPAPASQRKRRSKISACRGAARVAASPHAARAPQARHGWF